MSAPVQDWLPESAYEIKFVHASGPGGQHVNKNATAVELRVDVTQLMLSYSELARLRKQQGRRVNKEDVLVIQADTHRSQLKNRKEAWQRLDDMLQSARRKPKPRIATKPTRASKQRRIETKKIRGRVKNARKKPSLD